MGRPRLIGLLVGVSVLIALAAPTAALAGTFSWAQPTDFTTTTPGSNPEYKYGAVSWSYLVDASLFGSGEFSSNAAPCGGPGYADPAGCITATGGAVQMSAQLGHSVTVKWTNPFPTSEAVTVTSAFSSPLPLVCSLSVPSSKTLAPGASLSWTLTNSASAAGCSAAGTISISATTPGPTVTLNSPGTAPLHTAVVQLSGTASTGFTDSNQVTVAIYPGTDTSGSPVQKLTGSVDSSGNFAVTTPALPDGRYTAVASQSSSAGTGKSPAVTFQIKVHGPALTLDRPPGDVWVGRNSVSFSGAAGNAAGDAAKVMLQLYKGKSAGGSLAGKRELTRHGSSWSTSWHGLPLGYYTAVATQSDDAGHTTRTSPHTFRVVSKTTAFGSSVTVSGNSATAVVGCLASSTKSCQGTVLVVTKHSYRTTRGGPSGPLEVLFAKVRIPGGAMAVISGRVPSAVVGVLRRLRHVPVTVTSKLSNSGTTSASRVLRVT